MVFASKYFWANVALTSCVNQESVWVNVLFEKNIYTWSLNTRLMMQTYLRQYTTSCTCCIIDTHFVDSRWQQILTTCPSQKKQVLPGCNEWKQHVAFLSVTQQVWNSKVQMLLCTLKVLDLKHFNRNDSKTVACNTSVLV